MAYGEYYHQKQGIKKEEIHLPILNNILAPIGLRLEASSKKENKELKIDYWGKFESGLIYAFDFKTSTKPWEGFCLTYKMNNTTKNTFDVGEKNIISIFLLEDIYSYGFLAKYLIKEWYNLNHPYLHLSKSENDDSNFFVYPTSEILKEGIIKSYKTFNT